jgi:hypothetical protein
MTQADMFNVGCAFIGPDGTKYTIKKPTQYQQGEFQKFLEDRAHAAVARSSDSEERKLQRDHLIDIDAGLGMYEWEGQLANKAKWEPAGLAKILTILCRDQGVTDEKAEEILAHSLKEVAAKMLMQAVRDPKAAAPVLAALGYPMDWFESEPSEPSSSNCSTHPSTEASPNSEDSPTTSSSASTTSSEGTTG